MTQKTTYWPLSPKLTALACFTLFARIMAMIFFPLTDATEARYGEIARKMSETNDWITPQYDYGVPFWAKPPLSTWLSAASMDVFGWNEFAARLPSLLIALALLPLIYIFSEKQHRQTSIAMLLTMGLFYIAMGTVMTDMTLLLSCTLALVAFWFAVEEKSLRWGYAFFAALGIGMLAKGPIALVLSGLPVFVWLFWAKSWKKMFSSLPIFSGILLMLAICLPWYILAERKTPGFLEYFIVGEHFKRFLVPGWNGDLYGHAHEAPLGSIWPFLLADGFPWSFILPGIWGYRYFRKQPVIAVPLLDSRAKFLLCWLLLPNIFFTFAHNILFTYALVSMPALALLIAREIPQKGEIKGWFYLSGALLPALTLIGLGLISFHPSLVPNTAAYISRAVHKLDADAKLVYAGSRIYSMEFYNSGKVQRFDSVKEALKQRGAYVVLTEEQGWDLLPRIKPVAQAAPHYLIYKIDQGKKR